MNRNITFENVTVTDPFWKHKQEMIRNVTIKSVYHQFDRTGRVGAFQCIHPDQGGIKPDIFWDSDVAKWIESVAYLTQKSPEPELEKLCDSIIDQIEKNQLADGYFNSYYITMALDRRFTDRGNHELYCLGHLIEAAVEYKKATGKDKLYQCMLKYVDLVNRVFRQENSAAFVTPGHQEMELALVKLWQESGDPTHLELAKFFVDQRGVRQELPVRQHKPRYAQDHLPVREQTDAKGHAVRLFYLYAAMADLALETNDAELKAACERVFRDVVETKMYITGGIGSTYKNEGFEKPYYLPNETAYNETCASIAMVLFASRMQRLSTDSIYADIIERELYNGILSGISLDGKAFF